METHKCRNDGRNWHISVNYLFENDDIVLKGISKFKSQGG